MTAHESHPSGPRGTAQILLDLVRNASVGGRSGDPTDRLVAAAYVHGYRRFKSIVQLVEAGAAVEAMILTRALLSIAMRIAYLDGPRDQDERRRRYLQFRRRYIDDQLKALDELEAVGFEPDVDRNDLERQRAEIVRERDPGHFPTDRALFELVRARPFYPAVYMPGSDAGHFSLNVALDQLLESEAVDLDARDQETAEAVLALAINVYGMLLHLTERALEHDLGQRALALVAESPHRTARSSASVADAEISQGD